MEIGVKVGPRGWLRVLQQTKAQYVEIWFRLDWEKQYYSLFKYLRKNKINFGLHFWGRVKGKYYPSLLYLKGDIAAETFGLIKKTIEIAAKQGAHYVVFHPEFYQLALLDFDNFKTKLLRPDELIDRQQSFNQLCFYLEKIKKYGRWKKIIPFIETVPKFTASDFKNIKKGRLNYQPSEGLETERFVQLTKLGYPICFDLGSTLAQNLSKNKDELFTYLLTAAKEMKPAVGLIHLTTNLPPFNGTKSHDGILEEDFQRGVLPDKLQLIKLLSLFKDKKVWLIPEPPPGKMVANYFALQKIIKL